MAGLYAARIGYKFVVGTSTGLAMTRTIVLVGLGLIGLAALSGQQAPGPAAKAMLSAEAMAERTAAAKAAAESAAKAARAADERYVAFGRARMDVKARLRDPASAVFGDMAIGKDKLVCGYVNSRNGFGGMTGMQPFIAGYANSGVIFYQQGPESFAKHWNKICA